MKAITTFAEIRAFEHEYSYIGKYYIVVNDRQRSPFWLMKNGVPLPCHSQRFNYKCGAFGSVREAVGVIKAHFDTKHTRIYVRLARKPLTRWK